MGTAKIVDADQLDEDLTMVADAIREKSGGTEPLDFPEGYVEEINKITGGEEMVDAVLYTEQTLTYDQKTQARKNIGAQEAMVVENLKDQIVINYPDNITKQFTSFIKYGRICIFTVQLIVNTAVSDSYGFIVATLPKSTVDRIWINNSTQFFIEVGSNGIRRNGEGLAAGNYMLSGFYLAVE